MGNANQHSHVNVGHLIAGGKGMGIKGSRYIAAFGQPTSNLLLSVLRKFDVPNASIGDSTGTVAL